MNPRLTRNELLRRGAAGSALLAFPSLLAACGGGGGGRRRRRGQGRPQLLELAVLHRHAGVAQGRRRRRLRRRSSSSPTKTGIKVNYYEDINSNSEYFATIQGRLRQGDGIGRDIIVSTDNDRYLGEYISTTAGRKSSTRTSSRTSRTSSTRRRARPFDPNREYTLPWFSGMDGIAWNEEVTEPVTTVTQLLTDPKLKGRVGVWNSMGDTLGLIMLENGDDPAKVTDESFDRAIGRGPEGSGRGPDPPVLRQRLRAAAREGRPRREHGVVRRHLPARRTRT